MTLARHFTADRPLLLVGCGNMGGALAHGWLSNGLPADALWVVDPAPFNGKPDGVQPSNRVATITYLPVGFHPGMIVLAVKPQMMATLLPVMSSINTKTSVVMSIAAGTSLAYIAPFFDDSALIVRAMPNTPAAIGKGVTGLYCGAGPAAAQKTMLNDLLGAVGKVIWLKDEAQLNPLTAISGSGPAYVFHMVEALAAAAEAEGFAPEQAALMARETLIGAAALLEQGDVPAGQLRARVTSPAGTTAAALDVLMGEAGLVRLMREAVRAARRRSESLSNSSKKTTDS